MSTATAAATTVAFPARRRRSVAGRLTRALSHAPLNIILGVIALLWLVPSIGLLVTSFRPIAATLNSRWWNALTGAANFTTANYQSIISRRGLLEAARTDGASEWTMFTRIVLPLGLPALASLAIFQFLWVWNDLLVALVFLNGASSQPLTITIFSQIRQYGPNLDILSSAS